MLEVMQESTEEMKMKLQLIRLKCHAYLRTPGCIPIFKEDEVLTLAAFLDTFLEE